MLSEHLFDTALQLPVFVRFLFSVVQGIARHTKLFRSEELWSSYHASTLFLGFGKLQGHLSDEREELRILSFELQELT